MKRSFLDGRVELTGGDCLEAMRRMAGNSVDSVVTDPPYHLTSIVKRFGAANAALTKDRTGEAAWREGFSAHLIEREAEYQADIARRFDNALASPARRAVVAIKAKNLVADPGPLFEPPILAEDQLARQPGAAEA